MHLVKALFILATSLLAASAGAGGDALATGKTYYIHRQASGGDLIIRSNDPEWDFRNAFWVRLAKPTGGMKPGDSCFFVDGATVRVRGHTPDYGYLVEYVLGDKTKEACPNGAMAYVDGMPLAAFKRVPKPTPQNLEREADKILAPQQQ